MQRTGEVRFSVIVPVYNAANWLPACVGSIVAQPGPPDWECLLVDDGSTDVSPRMCDALAALCPGVTALHQANAGPAAARNAGIAAARGEWLLFLDSDDRWPADLLPHLRAALDSVPDADWYIGRYLEHAPGGPVPADTPPGTLTARALTGLPYPGRAAQALAQGHGNLWTYCLRRRFLQESGVRLFDDVSWAEDRAFTLWLLRAGPRLWLLPTVFTLHTADRPGSLANSGLPRHLHSIERLWRHFEADSAAWSPAEQDCVRGELGTLFWSAARAAACRDRALRRACAPAVTACRPLYPYGQRGGGLGAALFRRLLPLCGARFALWAGGLFKP